ncbi:triphosphoribosyl-dephospho-CoA synthase CitG [Aerococcus urinaehominis]|uniref:triphosphoribosyl-dephospho-CoA synthase CitG n=1 Tax=Aerococcus urinaehominis TaxID=128944 RepID=UPI000945D0AD
MCDQENLVKDLSNLALESVLEEASLTPKPGLVDALDAGAHDDMDLTTFIRSSLSLQAYFEAAAQLGYADKSAKAIFNSLRQLGIEAEQSMFAATQGVNTHKGVIFNMGVFLTASTACLRDYGQANLSSQAFLAKVYAYLRQMLAGLITNDWQDLASKEKLTHGERVYLEHGIAGIRREAELGYPTVQAGFYQYQLFKKSHPKTAKIRCLIYLMAYVEDTNVIKRGGMMGYNWLQVSCRNLTAANLDDQAFLDQVNHLNKTCKRRWISPGGAADLLSVVLYLDKFTDFLA